MLTSHQLPRHFIAPDIKTVQSSLSSDQRGTLLLINNINLILFLFFRFLSLLRVPGFKG